MVTNVEGLALGILTADCQPVLFADKASGVVGAAHAGWAGALNGVLENTVAAMERLGAVRESIVAVIGPSISQRAYEVGPEFMERFMDDDPLNGRFFAAVAKLAARRGRGTVPTVIQIDSLVIGAVFTRKRLTMGGRFR